VLHEFANLSRGWAVIFGVVVGLLLKLEGFCKGFEGYELSVLSQCCDQIFASGLLHLDSTSTHKKHKLVKAEIARSVSIHLPEDVAQVLVAQLSSKSVEIGLSSDAFPHKRTQQNRSFVFMVGAFDVFSWLLV
jgi:hypothetical protein